MMIEVEKLSKKELLSEETFLALFDIQTGSEREQTRLALRARAEEFKVKTDWTRLYSAYKKDFDAMERAKRASIVDERDNRHTDFDFSGLPAEAQSLKNLKCGAWQANMEDGIVMQTNDNTKGVLACYHPILPVRRLVNVQTQEERVEIAFYRNHYWHFHTVPRSTVSSAQKIVGLASVGVGVTSESAKALVRYLADIEAWNEDLIPVEVSSSKLGWHRGRDNALLFLPYDETEIHFDSGSEFRDLYKAISKQGDFDRWLALVKRIRAKDRLEARILLAASFASILVSRLDILPFFVDLWGETEGGKTVALMLAASVWGDPSDGKYIGDFKTTDTALEVKADLLNHLPMFLDDTSKTSARVRDNFEGIIYDLCSGKGKSRSNRALGTRRENRWKNTFICNGERPLNSYANQGGALNRIIEVECEPEIFENPHEVVEVVKNNYGHAGFDFVSAITVLSNGTVIKDTFEAYRSELMTKDGMQKQALSLACILTADALATDYIFQDGRELKVEDVSRYMQTRAMISDNERCYQYVVESAIANPSRFDLTVNTEQWGLIKDGLVYLLPKALESICKSGSFSKSSFISWAYSHALLDTDKGKKVKTCRYGQGGRATKMYAILLDRDEEEDQTEATFQPYEGEDPDFS